MLRTYSFFNPSYIGSLWFQLPTDHGQKNFVIPTLSVEKGRNLLLILVFNYPITKLSCFAGVEPASEIPARRG